MGLLDFFSEQAADWDLAAVATFVDENAAFLMQKGLYDIPARRAGHYAKVLFGEPEFQRAVEVSRWRAYPLGLAIVGEAVEGVLRERFPDARVARLLSEHVLAAVRSLPGARRPWRRGMADCRVRIGARLQLIGLHPPKRVIDIPEQWIQSYFDLMPIHEKLRGRDFPTTRNYLRAQLCNIHQEFVDRLDAAAVSASFETSGVAWTRASAIRPGVVLPYRPFAPRSPGSCLLSKIRLTPPARMRLR